MQMKQFVQQLSNALQDISDIPQYETEFESRASEFMNELSRLMNTYQDSQLEVSEENLKPFCQFLQNRFNLLRNTYPVYFLKMSVDNEKCWILAELLSPHLHIHFLKLLIPSLTMSDNDLDLLNLHFKVQWKNIFISEDGSTLLKRSQILDNAAKHGGRLQYISHHEIKNLTETEQSLLINFSKTSQNYYHDILTNPNNVKKTKRLFLKDLKKPYFINMPKAAAYGEAGEVRLKIRILENSRHLSDLITLIATGIPQDKWLETLQLINIDILKTLILNVSGENEIEIALKKLNYQSGNVLFDKVLGLCALLVYWTGFREQYGEFTSSVGRVFGRLVAYSKNDKKEAVEAGYQFLLSHYPFSACGLDEFLKDHNKEHIKGALLEKNSTLGVMFGEILKQDATIGNEENDKKKTSRNFSI